MAFFVLLLALSGCIDSPGDGVKVITVGATDCRGHIADFSGSGPTRDGRTKPDIVAPGVNVIASAPLGLKDLKYVDTYYARSSGTSLSTPAVAGVAALLLQKNPSLSPAGVKAALLRGAVRLNNTLGEEYEPYYQGAGLVNAYNSYRLLSDDLCGVMPDRWIVGRWAFMSGGKAVSAGLDSGADRPQKKIYALAPGDEDWTTRFVFFTDRARENLSVSVTGDVKGWITVMDLPESLAENSHAVFGASIKVPNGTAAGVYTGSVEICEKGKPIISVPVRVEIAAPLIMVMGSASVADEISPGSWRYYYLDVPLGTQQIRSRLSWSGSSDMDLFLLAPTSEYYHENSLNGMEESVLSNPASGRWILAVHQRNASSPERYLLRVERSFVRSEPGAWNAGTVVPGGEAYATILLQNEGLPLKNISYSGIVENSTSFSIEGYVSERLSWTAKFDVPEDVRRLSLRLLWDNPESDLDLRLYAPNGRLAARSEGYESTEEIQVYDPPPGSWTVVVIGYDVFSDKQNFELVTTLHTREPWGWLDVLGPDEIQPGTAANVNLTLRVPSDAPGKEVRGYLEIRGDNSSLEIPVVVTVAGASVVGVDGISFEDDDNNGFIDTLSIKIALNASVPGVYRAEGGLFDCSGRMIKWMSGSASVRGTGSIELRASGRDIWKSGGCGPLHLRDIILYGEDGDVLEEYNQTTIIERNPSDFQPPKAYFSMSFADMSERAAGRISSIIIGVGVTVNVPGTYTITARLRNDDGDVIGEVANTTSLRKGNSTVALRFNPTKFVMLGERSRIHLTDLTLSSGDEVLDRIDEAWSSSPMDPADFTSERAMVSI
ncbi:MAG: S8 family serine peptidase [Methanothrix sp.]|nr:S8 family serine peptidase [Methanothrix sp.]MCX8206390.1 S8 family serine peptidase [Methanothrix sp.]